MKNERYKIGDKVHHNVFGDGIITHKFAEQKPKRIIISVQFNCFETERNIIANFHGIRKIC